MKPYKNKAECLIDINKYNSQEFGIFRDNGKEYCRPSLEPRRYKDGWAVCVIRHFHAPDGGDIPTKGQIVKNKSRLCIQY